MKSYRLIVFLLVTSAMGAFGLSREESNLVHNVVSSDTFPIPNEDIQAIRAIGPEAIDPILQQYEKGNEQQRARLAWLLWRLGAKSERATELLLQDVRTQDTRLRLNVQYALGSVSNDKIVVEALLDNMRNDDNPLFRDNAACALAYDQMHLDEHQKYYLFRGLIDGLSDEKYQVRKIAIKALEIQTGQRMDYVAKASLEERNASIARWNQWLQEYQQSL